jgi:hypothetical protein
VYLVTRKRTEAKEKRTIIADNVIDAVKMALQSNHSYSRKTRNSHNDSNSLPRDTFSGKGVQLSLPIYFR